MIGSWTLEQISVSLALVVGIIGSVVYLKNRVKEWIEEFLEKKFEAIDKRFDNLDGKIDKVDMETCKNFLVRYLADVERSGSDILPQESQRFWEEYQHYIDNDGNSYIKEWVNKLKTKGLL